METVEDRLTKLEGQVRDMKSGLTSPSLLTRLLTLVGYQLLISFAFGLIYAVIWVIALAFASSL